MKLKRLAQLTFVTGFIAIDYFLTHWFHVSYVTRIIIMICVTGILLIEFLDH